MQGLYIHIPFCKSRCIYCGFFSTTMLDLRQQYVDALCQEMKMRCQGAENISTIYLGGGTPSQLTTDQLRQILHRAYIYNKVEKDAEVTIEVNPDDVTERFANDLTQLPVNRISMGAQTFNDRLLRFLSRRHDASQTVKAVEACKEAGITNISLDLIYGLPGQTMNDWQSDVEQAISLGITHLSAYALSYEEGTPLDKMLRRGDVEEADEELSRQMYNHLIAATRQVGFLHYEISNFALPGFHSRHNSSYWQGIPYLGLGAGAHSYDGFRSRRANLPDIKAYIAANSNVPNDERLLNDVPHEVEVLSDAELFDEFVMTRLRTSNGIPLDELSDDDRSYCLKQAEPHLAKHLLEVHNGHLCLTQEGIFTSNDIISDLMK